jgi:drug/metabolite transporter (DMT)-like permease
LDTVLEPHRHPFETPLLTGAALLAFAANSIFCRLALLDRLIDPAVFTAIRLCSGALILAFLSFSRGEKPLAAPAGNVVPGLLLFFYALPFTFAYTALPAGTGALLLFGSVQVTMMLAALRSGYRPSAVEWAGLATAFGGLVYLTAPGVGAPPLIGSALMVVAGIAWAFYTLRGKRPGSPLADTGGNFIVAALPSLVAGGVALPGTALNATGVWLAVASGALASGLGYTVWYRALRGLTAVRAAVVQLAVPVIAALGGVLFLAESPTARLLIAGSAVLGGIGLTIYGHRFRQPGGTDRWK